MPGDSLASNLGQNVLGGFLAAVAFAAATGAWKWVRRPIYIPFESKNWSERTKKLLEAAGYDPVHGDAGWVINYMVHDYQEQGRRIVHVGRWPCRREVRAERKEGYAVLMWKIGGRPGL